MAPPLPSNDLQPLTTPPPPLPSSTPLPEEVPGLCGLTAKQWHIVLILGICFLVGFFVIVIVAWLNSVEIPFIWLQAQQRAEMTRMGLHEKLVGHLLSEDDVRTLTPGAAITPRRYPIVDFVLAPLLPPVQRGLRGSG